VLLRRRLDYAIADQAAEVEVADATVGAGVAAFAPAGLWLTAGSNRVVYANPPLELGPPGHDTRTSNRRFLEDEFLLPPDLTRGKSKIRVRLRYAPQAKPLTPDGPPLDGALSEYRYTAYCYVLPSP